MTCIQGRRGKYYIVWALQFLMINIIILGSFEVQINDTLVHSKLASLAFPDQIEVVQNVKNALEGREVKKVKELPITDCIIQ